MQIESYYPTSLSSEETNTLARQYQEYISLRKDVGGWLNQRLGRPPALKEIKTEIQSDVELAGIQTAGLEAFDRLYAGHFRLIPRFAKSYLGKGLDYEDLFQEGSIGLLRSIEDYNPKEGAFSTHAAFWIKKKIIRAIEDKGSNIRRPVHIHEILGKIAEFINSYTQDFQKYPSLDEITAALRERLPDPPPIKLIPDKIRNILDSARRPFYLYEPDPYYPNLTLADTVPDSTALEDQINIPEDLQRIKSIIELEVELKPNEKRVFFWMEGLEDGRKWSSREVEAELNISQTMVSYLRNKAKEKIKKNEKLRRMYDED